MLLPSPYRGLPIFDVLAAVSPRAESLRGRRVRLSFGDVVCRPRHRQQPSQPTAQLPGDGDGHTGQRSQLCRLRKWEISRPAERKTHVRPALRRRDQRPDTSPETLTTFTHGHRRSHHYGRTTESRRRLPSAPRHGIAQQELYEWE